MSVYRRRVLATAGLSFSTLAAGCSQLVPGFPTGQPARVVSLGEVDTVGADHPVDLDVEQSTTAMGDGSMPTLEIELRTTSDSALFLGYRGTWPAGGLVSDRESDPGGLRLLAASEASDLTIDSEDCPSTGFRPLVGESLGGHRVSPDRRYRVTYRVLGSDQELDAACPPAGRYRWRSSYEYASATAVETVGWESVDRTRFDWDFSLEVQQPDAF